MTTRLNRRDLLRGIGAGAVLLAPFASHRVTRAQALNQGGNLLVFHTPNGFWRSQFGAVGEGDDFQLLPSLAPLQAFKNDLTVIRGLCCKSVSEKSSHEDISRILTCIGSGSDGSAPGDGGTNIAEAYGPSIDHHISTELNLPSPLTLGVEPRFGNPTDWNGRLSWQKSGSKITQTPAQTDPRVIFDDLFGGVMAEPQSVAQSQSVLDALKDDIEVMRPRLSNEDRGHLDVYLSSLAEIEGKLSQLNGDPNACAAAGLADHAELSEAADDPAQLQANGEAMMDLAASAFACGLKRTSTLQWQRAAAGVNPATEEGDHHNVSHGEAGPREETQTLIDLWYAQRFAYQLGKLKELGILDQTIVVWLSEISEEHNQNDFVIVVAGGKDLGIKLGQYINYPYQGGNGLRSVGRLEQNTSLSDLWVTVQNAMGIQAPVFGEAGVCGGPLTALRST